MPSQVTLIPQPQIQLGSTGPSSSDIQTSFQQGVKKAEFPNNGSG